jgi:hypothetical protein
MLLLPPPPPLLLLLMLVVVVVVVVVLVAAVHLAHQPRRWCANHHCMPTCHLPTCTMLLPCRCGRSTRGAASANHSVWELRPTFTGRRGCRRGAGLPLHPPPGRRWVRTYLRTHCALTHCALRTANCTRRWRTVLRVCVCVCGLSQWAELLAAFGLAKGTPTPRSLVDDRHTNVPAHTYVLAVAERLCVCACVRACAAFAFHPQVWR